MPDRLKWSGIGVATIAGLLIGFAVSTLLYRYRVLQVPRRTVVQRMSRELGLTPPQRLQVIEIMQDTHLKMRQARLELHRKRRQILWQAFSQIRSVLTPEQQQKFDRDFTPPEARQQSQPAPSP